MHPLLGLRVVDLTTGVAGGYATKLFVDAGAAVVKVEPPGGDPLRSWSASGADLGDSDGALFRFLGAGKTSLTGSPTHDAVARLIAAADLVVDSGVPALLDKVPATRPDLVLLSITPFGRTGPMAGRPATEFTIQAECGSIGGRGDPTQPPVQAGGRIAEWAAGATGAVAALATVRRAERTGRGGLVDVSWLEVMAQASGAFADLYHSLMGRPPITVAARAMEIPSIERTADGYAGFNTNGPNHLRAFFELVEQPWMFEDPSWRTMNGRLSRREEWDAIVGAWMRARTTDEVLDRAGELRVPSARVNNARTVLDEPQLVERGFFVRDSSGSFRHPAVHYLVDGARPPMGRPAPALGAGPLPEWSVRTAPATGTDDPLPLTGLRVLDLTCWWAGPATTQFLGALGADVVHVESTTHPDPMRSIGYLFSKTEQPWERSWLFLTINTNKRGITLDMGSADGVDLAHRLVGWADVVIENYTPRVMDKWGLDWSVVHELNPAAVMLRMPAFGLDGPWRDRLGFAQNMEQMTGMAWLTGYGDEPQIPRGPCDPVGGLQAAFALLGALRARDETGEGSLVEVPLLESALNVAAEQVIEYTAYGTVLSRDGNRSPHTAPQGLYAGRGDDEWLAISVETDEQWAGLRAALGEPGWAQDSAFEGRAGRRTAHDAIDGHLAAWTKGRDLDESVALLVGHGVPAARVVDPRRVHLQPQLADRGFFETVQHPVVGEHLMTAMPFRIDGIDRWIRSPAPTLGQHTDDVLSSILGLDDTELTRLRAAGVIGDRPA